MSTSLASPSPAPSASRTPLLPAGSARIAVALAITAMAFALTWASFPGTWIEKGSHQFVAAGFAGWLLWRARARLLTAEEPLGIVTVAIGALSLAWMVTYVLNTRALHQAIVPAVLFLWLVAVGGVRVGRAALPAFAVFSLAVPVWGSLIRPLQTMTVMANAVMLSFTDITAQIEGDFIAIPAGVFHVASGCAGFNYFEVGLLISVIYALLFLRSWPARFIAIAAGVTLALVSNWLRVFGLIVIGHVTEMQSPLIASHGTYGWVIFALVLALFFVVLRPLERWDERQRPAEDVVGAEQRARAIGAAGGPSHAPIAWSTVAAPTTAAMLGPVLYLLFASQPSTHSVPDGAPGIQPSESWELLSSAELPPYSGDPQAEDTATTATEASSPVSVRSTPPWQLRYLGADRHVQEEWGREDRMVRVERVIYLEQSQSKELINSGNRIATAEQVLGETRIGPLDEHGRMVNASVVRTKEGARLAWHWFHVAGASTHSPSQAKLQELVGFTTRSSAAELVVVSTPCGESDCNEASRLLWQFVANQLPPERGESLR